ncbi:MAG: cytochrome C [Deltaproteobacteria bacterium]|nr:cytochrome C [Deltaproteobacteria bacterium]TLN04388.1 MAG: cytochrome C [bacterium]
MRNHVWRPLYLVIAVIALILLVRTLVVPEDFGSHESGYMYGWHRKGNEAEWQQVKVKYQMSAYCKDCHSEMYDSIGKSPHGIIPCEDCHGPGAGHPDNPAKLPIDRSRQLCLRCHAQLPSPSSGRSAIRGIDPAGHNPEAECSLCHNPHNPSLAELP